MVIKLCGIRITMVREIVIVDDALERKKIDQEQRVLSTSPGGTPVDRCI